MQHRDPTTREDMLSLTQRPEFTKLGLRKPWFKTRQNASYDVIFLDHGLNYNTGLYVKQWTT